MQTALSAKMLSQIRNTTPSHPKSHPGHWNDEPPPRREPAENKGGGIYITLFDGSIRLLH